MPKPTPILFISSRSNSGAGGERYLHNVMRHLDRARFKPIVLLPAEGSFRQPLEELDVEVYVVETNYGWLKQQPNWYRALDSIPARVEQIRQLIGDTGTQLVHTNSNIRLEGMLAANLAGIHHIYAARVDFQPELEIFQRLGLDREVFARIMGDLSTKVLSVSDSVASTLSPPIKQEKIRVIHNGLDLDTYDAILQNNDNHIRAELDLTQDDILISAAGRIASDKGFDTYLASAVQVINKYPNAHFLIAGEVENESFHDQLQALAKEKKIEANVHFLGFRKDIYGIYAESDIFVLSSRREGQSNALLEAMACQCAVVATRCSGVEEAVRHNETGFIVDIEDIDDMTHSIMRLAADRKMRNAFATAGLTLMRTHFQLNVKIQELMTLYDETLSMPTPYAGSPAVHIILRQAKEIGDLGLRVDGINIRLRQVEQFMEYFTQNPLAKILRKIIGK